MQESRRLNQARMKAEPVSSPNELSPKLPTGADALPDGLGVGRKADQIISRAADEKEQCFSPTRSRFMRRWGRTRCFTIMRSRPGASTEMGGSQCSR